MKTIRLKWFGSAVIAAFLFNAQVASADSYIGNGGATEGYEDGAAYIKYVRWENSASANILRLQLQGDFNNWEGCTHIIMTEGVNGKTKSDLLSYEKLALTAVTTGMKIMARKLTRSDTGHCEVKDFRFLRSAK